MDLTPAYFPHACLEDLFRLSCFCTFISEPALLLATEMAVPTLHEPAIYLTMACEIKLKCSRIFL